MKPVSAPTALKRVPLDRRGGPWRERSAHLYSEFERQARTMVKRGFRGAFSEDEIDDIYSTAWVGVLRALEVRHRELGDEEIRSYVLTAVANQAGKEIRRRKRKPTAPLELVASMPDLGSSPEEAAAEAERSRVTRDLLASLPPRRRAVMLLRYGWGLEPQQVCGLVKGLSPRAYRKEVTRGIDELTERVRAFERGEWCADREPLIKAYAAGLADPDEERQAQAHLSHCRECSDFIAKLSGHLHDVGGALAVPAALEGLDVSLPLGERVVELGERLRDSTLGLLGRGHAPGAEETATAIAASGGARGTGAVGAGVVAKLAALGTAGKAAIACAGGGVAATACVAAGVGPFSLAGDAGRERVEPVRAERERPERTEAAPTPAPGALPSQLAEQEDAAPPAPPATRRRPADAGQPRQPSPNPAAEQQGSAPATPVAPTAPAGEQEFGVAAAAATTAPPPAPPSSPKPADAGGAQSAAEQEFLP